MTIIESILRDLREVSPAQLLEVARYVQTLNPVRQERRRAALLATAGCLAGEIGEDFQRSVRADSERVDGDCR